jgi:transposase
MIFQSQVLILQNILGMSGTSLYTDLFAYDYDIVTALRTASSGGTVFVVLAPVDTNCEKRYNGGMKINEAQYERIAGHFPVQRGNVKTENRDFVNAILYMAENGCKWRALPPEFGKWQTIYKKFSRWAKSGVMQRIFAALQAEEIIAINVEVLALDSTSCKVHPNGHGALKNSESKPLANQRAVGIPSFMWYPQMIRSSLKCTFPAENVTTVPKEEYR